MKIFSGQSNEELARNICDKLNIPLGNINHKSFASGELYCQFKENIRGDDVFIIQPTSFPANDNLMQLFLMADAARRASAGRITAVIPYFGYARQDRKDKSRVPISAKLVMDLMSAAGFDRVVTMDLHASQIGGFTNLPVDHLTFQPSLITALKDLKVVIDTVVSPDIGAVKRTEHFVESLSKRENAVIDLAIISKKRKTDTEVEVTNFIGDVEDKRVLLFDDLTESLGTLLEGVKACKRNGASEINIAVTHGCFSDKGIENLKHSLEQDLFKRMFFSNTVYLDWEKHGLDQYHRRLIQVDVSSVFATAISRIHNNESVSELFTV